MIAPALISSFPLQLRADWRPDWPSLLLGIGLGVLLMLAVRWLVPYVLAWRDQAVGRVQETYAWMRSGVENRFQTETADYVQHYHLAGRQARLDQLFVSPRLLAPPAEPDPETASGRDLAQYARLWPELAAGTALPPLPSVSLHQLLLNGRRVIISSPAGSGKTTLLAYCAHLCATAVPDDDYDFLLPFVPIFVHLADLELPPDETAAGPAEPLVQALQERAGSLSGVGLSDLIRQKLEAGHGLLLLDGLDELAPAGRPAVDGWLAELLARYPDTRVLAAASERGYGSWLALDFIVTGLVPWGSGQAEKLGRLWAEAAATKPLRLGQYWQPGQDVLKTILRLRLQAAGGDVRPSSSTTDLLAASLEAWLAADDNRDDTAGQLRPAARDFLQRLAHASLEMASPRLSRTELVALAGQTAAEFALPERAAAASLQKRVSNSPLLVGGPAGDLRFISPVLRDYLAACHWEQNQADLAALITLHLREPTWAGSLRFYAAEADVSDLVTQLLAASEGDLTAEGIFQAAGWLVESMPGIEWRRQILIRLGQFVMTKNAPVALRWRAATAMVASGEPGVGAFIRQLAQQAEPVMRRVAASIVVGLQPEFAVELLQKLLSDKDERVRVAAVYALGWLADPAAERPLLLALLGDDQALSRTVAEVLAMKGGDSKQILDEALGEESLAVRRAAVYGLAQLDDPWAVTRLQQVTREDGEWMVQSAAKLALEEIAERKQARPWEPRRAENVSWLLNWAARRGQAVPTGAGAQSVLHEVLVQGDSTLLKVTAALTLGDLTVLLATPALRSALRHPDQSLRDAAFLALCLFQRAYYQLPEAVIEADGEEPEQAEPASDAQAAPAS